jgi:hypothetical protein
MIMIYDSDTFLHIQLFISFSWMGMELCENFESRTAIKYTKRCRVLLPNTKELLFYCSRGPLTQTPNERRLSREEKFKWIHCMRIFPCVRICILSSVPLAKNKKERRERDPRARPIKDKFVIRSISACVCLHPRKKERHIYERIAPRLLEQKAKSTHLWKKLTRKMLLQRIKLFYFFRPPLLATVLFPPLFFFI